MHLADVLSADRILLDLTVSSKKTLLEKMAALLARDSNSSDKRQIFESLCQREHIGSTGLGHGVAIPHGRSQNQKEIVGAIIRLKKPIDFDAADHERVDLFFALSIPEECTEVHHQLLADLADFFKDASHLKAFRSVECAEDLLTLISDAE